MENCNSLVHQLKDPLNSMESWKQDSAHSPCDFNGITCDPSTLLITEIHLENRSLSGEISPSISVLKSLNSLILASNAISGSLPSQLISCTNLRVLNVTGNKLTGSIPDLSALRNLQALDLSINLFSGALPDWVGNLIGLTSLGLGENDFDEGQVPGNLGGLKNLTWLYLSDSNLIGEIPLSIFELQSLQMLDMCHNKLLGNFPKEISKLRNLKKIELYVNNLTGEIPKELAELTYLKWTTDIRRRRSEEAEGRTKARRVREITKEAVEEGGRRREIGERLTFFL